MPTQVGTQIARTFDWVVCKTAGITFDAIQFFNKRNPNPSVTPKWSDKPLLKSWEKTKPTLGFPRQTDSLCPACVKEAREGRRDQSADCRARWAGLDGKGLPAPRPLRRHDGR